MSTIWIDDTYAGESDGTATFTLRRLGNTDNTDTVDFTTVQHFASPGSDYADSNGTITFAPGETVKTVQVNLIDDGAAEFNEAFELQLLNASAGVLIGRSSAYATIFDNDAAAGPPGISAVDAIVNEVENSATVWFKLDKPAAGAFTIDYATADDGAIAGEDYVAASGSLTFAPGEMVKPVTIDLIDDANAESTESFFVELSNPVGAPIAGSSPAEIRIFDADGTSAEVPLAFIDPIIQEDDGTGAGFILLNSAAFLATVFTLLFVAATAQPFSHFSPAVVRYAVSELLGLGWLAFPFSFAVGDDLTPNQARTLFAQLVSANPVEVFTLLSVLTLFDNDGFRAEPTVSIDDYYSRASEGDGPGFAGPGGGFIEFEVYLDGWTDHEVLVEWDTLGWTALAGEDYFADGGVVRFAPGETSKTIRVDLIGDFTRERFVEEFDVELHDPMGAQLGHRWGTGVIFDDDRLGFANNRWLYAQNQIVGENDVAAGLRLGGFMTDSELARVQYSLQSGTASLDDYVPFTNDLTLTHSYASTDIALRDDLIAERFESLKLDWTNNSGPSFNLGFSSTYLTVIDNDGTGPARFNVTDAWADEFLGVSFFTIFRTGDTSLPGSVDFSFSSGSAIVGAGPVAEPGDDIVPLQFSAVHFSAGEVVRNIAFVAIDDAVAEDDEFANVNLTNPQGGTIGDGWGRLLIQTNDKPPPANPQPAITITPEKIGEGSPFVDIELRLTAPSLATVSVDFETLALSATSADFLPDSGTVMFPPFSQSMMLRVPIIDDGTQESDEVFTLQLSNPVNAVLAGGAANITIVDNDAAPGVPQITIDDYSAPENGALQRFAVRLDKPSTDVVEVDFATIAGTALSGPDFAGSSGLLRFAPGSTLETLWVSTVDDLVTENDETFTMELSNAQGATIARATALGTILANDPMPDPPVIVSATDDVPRFTGTVASGGLSNDPTLLLAGTVEPNLTVSVFLGTGLLGSTVADATGAWSFTTAPLTQGTVPFEAIAISGEGVHSLPSNVYPVTIDTTAPPRPVIESLDDDVGAITGVVPNQGSTDDTRPEVIGTAEPGSVIEIRASTVLVGTAITDSGGNWSSQLATLTPGVKQLSATAIDEAGNVSPDANFGFTLLNVIEGTAGDDDLAGTAMADQFNAGGGDDTMEGMDGDDLLLGGDGLDAGVFSTMRANATIAREADGVRVTGNGPGAALGSDFGMSVERFGFSDTTIAMDTRAFGDNAFDYVAMHYAAFNAMPGFADFEQFLPALDADPSKGVADVAQAMLDFYLPGGIPNETLVAYLWLQIFGSPGPLDAITLYAGLIGTPQFPDQAALAGAAAGLEPNLVKFAGQIDGGVDLGPQWVI